MTVRMLQGHAPDVLAGLPAGSVHSCVCSPPYWQLRDYGTPPQVWPAPSSGDGTPPCPGGAHAWADATVRDSRHRDDAMAGQTQRTAAGSVGQRGAHAGASCARCGAWSGEWGQEPDPELYVAHTVAVFRAVWRVLRDDGTLWLNLGPTYWNDPGGQNGAEGRIGEKAREANRRVGRRQRASGAAHAVFKRKDLVGVPWLVALALQADGWYLRSEIIWHKGNPLPESVADRPTRAHEPVFLLAKRPTYYYDAAAIAEPVDGTAHPRRAVHPKAAAATDDRGIRSRASFIGATGGLVERRNRRSVWTIPVAAYSGAHFATFPPALVEPCVLAGTSERGCCPGCGAPWRRVVRRSVAFGSGSGRAGRVPQGKWARTGQVTSGAYDIRMGPQLTSTTVGWRPGCACPPQEPVPCTVLDPCAGAGTTGLVADRLGRDSLLIELKPEYATLARQRVVGDAPLFADVSGAGGDEECAG